MNERVAGARNAAIVATRRGSRTTWHTLRPEAVALEPGARLRRHKADALDGARSLEGLIHRFGDAEIVYDPTGAFERARRLVSAARTARKALGRRLVSLHVLENGRTVFARARIEADVEHIAPAVGAAFARALSGADFQITVSIGVKPPPANALPMERIGARRDQMIAAAQRLSAALAVAGAAVYGMGAETAAAAEPVKADDCALPPAASAHDTRTVRAIYSRAGDLVALHLADEDRGGEQQTAQRALAAVRAMTPARLDDALRGHGLAAEGLHFKARRSRTADGIAYAIDISAEAPEAVTTPVAADGANGPVYYPIRAPEPAAPVAAIAALALAPVPETRVAYAEVGANAVVRGDQSGAIAQGDVQFTTAPGWAVGLQGAIGTLDGDIAGGAQALVQHVMTVNGVSTDVGAFVSGVQSTAPSGEDFGIVRVGAGVAATIAQIDLIVRGGYASGNGDLDGDGGFARAEGAWFATPNVALTGFVETDPTTGAGAGAGVSFKPFTGTLANMMIDADAAWHEDGEESFRLGLRWLLGRKESTSLKDTNARKGMSPDLMDDLRRLPDELMRNDNGGLLTQQTQPYCGEAGDACPTK